MTQSLIIYRNPIEAAFWESGMFLPLMCGVLVGVALAAGAATIYEKLFPKQRGKYSGQIAIITGAFGVIFTMFMLAKMGV